MNAGTDYTRAHAQAEANATRSRRPWRLFNYGGVWWTEPAETTNPPGSVIVQPTAPTGPTLKRVLRITSHAGHARYLHTLTGPIGYITRRPEIPSPYAYSPTHTVYQDPTRGPVIIVETMHKRYDVFSVDPSVTVYPTDDDATAAYIAQTKSRFTERFIETKGDA